MTIDEVNLPIFVAAFNIAYANNKDKELLYEELISQIKKETNLTYYMMIEALASIKK